MLKDKTNISSSSESCRVIGCRAIGQKTSTMESQKGGIKATSSMPPSQTITIHQHDLLLRFEAFHGCMQVCSTVTNPPDADFRKFANYFLEDGFRNLRRALNLDDVLLSPSFSQNTAMNSSRLSDDSTEAAGQINAMWGKNHEATKFSTDVVLNVLGRSVMKDKNCRKLLEKLRKEEGENCDQVRLKVGVVGNDVSSLECSTVIDVQRGQVLYREQLVVSQEAASGELSVQIWNQSDTKILARGCIALEECLKSISEGYAYRTCTPDMKSSSSSPILMRNLCTYMNMYHSIQLPLSLDTGHVIVEVPCSTATGKDVVVQLEVWNEQCAAKKFEQGLQNGVLFVPGPNTKEVSVITVQEVFEVIFKAGVNACQCNSQKLRLSFEWQWMLSKYAQYYNLREQYTILSYLRWLVQPQIWTPTGHCLTALSDNLKKVKNLFINGELQEQEIYIFQEIQKKVIRIIQYTVENFKFLSVENQQGISSTIDMNVEDPEALHSAIEIFTLVMDKEHVEDQEWLIDAFIKGAQMAFQSFLHEHTEMSTVALSIEETSQLICGVTELIQHDQQIHEHHILPEFVQLPRITSPIYTTYLRSIVVKVLDSNSGSGPGVLMEMIDQLGKLEKFLQQQQLEALDVLTLIRGQYDCWLEDVEKDLTNFITDYGDEYFEVLCSQNSFPQSELSKMVPDKLLDGMTQLSIVIQYWPSLLQPIEQTVCTSLRNTLYHLLQRTGISRTPDLTGWEWDLPQPCTMYYPNALGSLYQVEVILLNSLYEFLLVLPNMEKKFRGWIDENSSVENGGGIQSHNRSKSQVGMSFGMYFKGVFQELRSLYSFSVLESAARMQRAILSDPESNVVSILGYQNVADLDYIRSILEPTMEHIEDALNVMKEALKTPVLVACLRALWDCFGSCLLNFVKANEADWIKGQNAQLASQVIDAYFIRVIRVLLGQNVQNKDLESPKNVKLLQALFEQSMKTSYRVV